MNRFPTLTGSAGAAFLLNAASKEGVILAHPLGHVRLRESAPYVTVDLKDRPINGDVKSVAWQVIQESLDVLSARGLVSLLTSKGDTEYLYWVRTENLYELTCVTTAEEQWSIQGHITVGNQTETPPPPSPPFFHHECLRYYRMSKCTSDLFDAYRNAYMGFECLVSSESPKHRHESELAWLKRVVKGPLRAGVPSGVEIDSLLEEIYRNGRNPLFHAKSGQTFHPPHSEVREEIQELFERLTLLLVALIQYKYGNHVIRRWASISQGVQDNQARLAYEFDELQFPYGNQYISVQPEKEVIQSPRRFGQLWAIARVERPTSLNILRKVRFLRQGNDWMELEFEENIPLQRVCRLTFEINMASRNSHQPKLFHLE